MSANLRVSMRCAISVLSRMKSRNPCAYLAFDPLLNSAATNGVISGTFVERRDGARRDLHLNVDYKNIRRAANGTLHGQFLQRLQLQSP